MTITVSGSTLRDLMTKLRKEVAKQALEYAHGNQCEAAKWLEIHRNTFRRLVEEKSYRMQNGRAA